MDSIVSHIIYSSPTVTLNYYIVNKKASIR